MANVLPTELFAGYDLLAPSDTVAAAGIFIPLASIPALNAAEADPVTGNGMEIVRAIQHQTYKAIAALSDGSKPTKATITKEPNQPLPNGDYQTVYINRFQVSFSDENATMASE